MPHLLLNLRDVPEDEADEVRALLDGEGLEFYETKPSLWGVSAGGIWLPEDGDAARARVLLAEYQARRERQARDDRERARLEGRLPGAWSSFGRDPARALAALLGILLMLAVATLPFLFFF